MKIREIKRIDVEEIEEGNIQVRERIDKYELQDLEKSIATIGLINPIVVTQKKDGYRLVAGARRLQAHKNLGRQKILSMIIDDKEGDVMATQLHENWGRVDISPVEEGKFFLSLIRKEYTINDVADMGGMTAAYVKGRIGLACMPKVIRNLLEDKKISIEGAKLLCRITKEKTLNDMCSIISEGGMGTQTIKNWIMQYAENNEKPPEEIIQIEYERNDSGEKKKVFRCSVCAERYEFNEVTSNWICRGCTMDLQRINTR